MAETGVAPQSPAPSGGLRLLLGLIALPLVAGGFAVVAARHPVVGTSLIGVAFLTLLLVIGLIVLFSQWNPDLLDPLRLIAAFFLLVYCINPLVGGELDWHFMNKTSHLVAESGAFALVALIFLAIGYHLPIFRPFPRAHETRSTRPPPPMVIAYGLVVFFLGFAAYMTLFVAAGGVQGIVAGEEHRMDFTRGIGWLLHASLFMFTGGALYLAAHASRKGRAAWVAAWPLLIAFLLFILLQNRSRAFWAVAIGLVVWHYQVSPLRVRKLAPYVAALGVLFVFVGFARHTTIRPLLLTDPLAVIREAALNFGDILQGHLGFSLNRLQQLMLALDSYPDRAPWEWGRTFVSMFNPVFRFVGLGGLQAPPLGGEFFRLAHPEAPLYVTNGYHPSLLGELLANYPWPLALLAAMGYGIALRALYSTLVVKRRDFVSLALYAAVIYSAASMVIWGFGSALFRVMVIAAPILLVMPLVPARGAPQRLPNAWEGAKPDAAPGAAPRGDAPLRSSAHR